MKKSLSIKRIFACLLAALMLSALVGCGGSNSGSGNLTSALESTKEKVAAFSHDQRRNAAIFAKDMFGVAADAAKEITDDATAEELEKIAQELSLDSITVADATRTVIASYPEDETGKNLNDIEDKKEFSSIVRNTTDRQMTDPVYDAESGKYSLMAGVKRSDGTGVVIVSLKTEKYADVLGASLAQDCGENTVIMQNDAVISSTLAGVSAADTMDKLGITGDDLKKDSFTMTVDGTEYICKAAVISERQSDGITVICAEAK